jgi:hypothetical protein
MWTEDEDWKGTSAVDFSIVGRKIEIGRERRLAARLRYACVEVARGRAATVFPDGVDTDFFVRFFHSEYIFGWEYERSLNSRVRFPLRIEKTVRECRVCGNRDQREERYNVLRPAKMLTRCSYTVRSAAISLAEIGTRNAAVFILTRTGRGRFSWLMTHPLDPVLKRSRPRPNGIEHRYSCNHFHRRPPKSPKVDPVEDMSTNLTPAIHSRPGSAYLHGFISCNQCPGRWSRTACQNDAWFHPIRGSQGD